MKTCVLFTRTIPALPTPWEFFLPWSNALRSFYPALDDLEEEIIMTVTRLLSKVRTLAAMSYKISKGP